MIFLCDEFVRFIWSCILSLYVYYAIPVFIAIFINGFKGSFGLFALLTVVGTMIHELLHLSVGILTMGHPVGFSIWPKKADDGGYVLGSVSFTNIRWYNGVFIGGAPLIGVVLFWWIGQYGLEKGQGAGVEDLGLWFLMAQLLLSSWPSPVDWWIMLRSWPIAVMAVFFVLWQQGLIQMI